MQKNYYLNDESDKDIIEFLETLPSNKQSEIIRKAIRLYIQQEKEGGVASEARIREIAREEIFKYLKNEIKL